MPKRKSKRKRKKSDILIYRVTKFEGYYHYYKCGSLFLLKRGFYVVTRRRRLSRLIRKRERDRYGEVRTIIRKERRLKLWLKPVFLRGRIANGYISLMDKNSKARVLKYMWSECN